MIVIYLRSLLRFGIPVWMLFTICYAGRAQSLPFSDAQSFPATPQRQTTPLDNNRDGNLDFLAVNTSGTCSLILNNGHIAPEFDVYPTNLELQITIHGANDLNQAGGLPEILYSHEKRYQYYAVPITNIETMLNLALSNGTGAYTTRTLIIRSGEEDHRFGSYGHHQFVNVRLNDLNGDGLLDVYGGCTLDQQYPFSPRTYSEETFILINQDGNTFAERASSLAIEEFTGAPRDLNGDGLPDLLFAENFPHLPPGVSGSIATRVYARLLQNPATLQYGPPRLIVELPQPDWPLTAQTGDLTGDGNTDLALLTPGGVLELIEDLAAHLDDAPVRRVLESGPVDEFRLLDFDADGRLDVLMRKGANYWILRAGGTDPPGFTRRLLVTADSAETAMLAIQDLDRDGDTDLLVRDGAGLSYFQSQALWPPAFVPYSFPLLGLNGQTWLGVQDLDRDGFPDVLARNELFSFGLRNQTGDMNAARSWMLYP